MSNKKELGLQCVVYNDAGETLEFHDCDKGIHLIGGKQVTDFDSSDCAAHKLSVAEYNAPQPL